jgi:hypothetical protein
VADPIAGHWRFFCVAEDNILNLSPLMGESQGRDCENIAPTFFLHLVRRLLNANLRWEGWDALTLFLQIYNRTEGPIPANMPHEVDPMQKESHNYSIDCLRYIDHRSWICTKLYLMNPKE